MARSLPWSPQSSLQQGMSYHGQVWQIHVIVELVLLQPALGQVVDVGVGLRVFPLHQAVNRQQDRHQGDWICSACAAFLAENRCSRGEGRATQSRVATAAAAP